MSTGALVAAGAITVVLGFRLVKKVVWVAALVMVVLVIGYLAYSNEASASAQVGWTPTVAGSELG